MNLGVAAAGEGIWAQEQEVGGAVTGAVQPTGRSWDLVLTTLAVGSNGRFLKQGVSEWRINSGSE